MSKFRLLVLIAGLFILLQAAAAAAQTQGAAPQRSYQRLLDDEEFLSAEAPASWTDTATGPWVVDGRTIGVYISAAPDLAAFEANNGPGVFIGLTHEGIPAAPVTEQPEDAVFARASSLVNAGKGRVAGCHWAAKLERYVDAHHTGAFDVATQCVRDQGRGQYTVVDLMPLSQNYRLSLRIGAVNQADRTAVGHILGSVQVLNPQMVDLHHDE